MRVLFVTRGLAPDDNSQRGRIAAHYLADLRRHHAVDLVAGYTRGRRLIPDHALGVDLCGRGPMQSSWALRRAVWQRARRGGPDIIVSGSVDAPRCGRPAFVLLSHVPDADEGWTGRATVARLNAFTGVLTPDDAVAEQAARAGVSEGLLRVLPPGVSPVDLAPARDDIIRFVSVGPIAPAHGQHLVIDAVSRLAVVEKARVCLDLAGHVEDPVYLGHLRVQAHGQPVRIHADPDPAFVDTLLAGASTLVDAPLTASRYPLDVVRAGLSGIPMVLADHPRSRALIGHAATYITPGDSTALRDVLQASLYDPGAPAARAQGAVSLLRERFGRDQTSKAIADWLRAMV